MEVPPVGTGLTLGLGTEWFREVGRSWDVALLVWQGGRDELRSEGRPVADGLRTHGKTVRLRVGYRLRARAEGERPD